MTDKARWLGVFLNPVLSKAGYPRLHICLDEWRLVGGDSGNKTQLLSYDIQNEQEVDDAVDDLVRNLEAIRIEAKNVLRRERNRPPAGPHP